MKECTVKMEETRVSEIQIETKDEKGPVAVSPQEERQERKTATLCFKRRKKANKMKPKAGSETAEVTKKCPPEAGVSPQLQPAGAWASIKRFVTRRKRSESSKKPKLSEPEAQPEDVALPEKKAKSRLKIPCLRFSRGAKRSRHSKLTEDSGYVRVQGDADDLEIKAQTQLADQAIQGKSTQGLQEDVLAEDGKEGRESHVSNSVTSAEKVISVELELENQSSAIQMETTGLETETKVITEKPSVQAQQANLFESSEAASPQPVASAAPPSPAAKQRRGVEQPSANIQESAPSAKDEGSRGSAAEEKKAEEIALSQAPDLKENGIDAEKPRSEESKRMEPIAIIITDTEISEFDVKKSKNVPKQFLVSMENEQVGVFANDGDFDGRTSEQYETLLIETASSLVKNAIELSVEQLVNEMVSGDDKINALLQ
ncbi:A-kinase anchor protein 5 [Acomys russatus]|uniref:A-kinase anchor protein 5 n=1 Tax=Acomys russatus TaxID=60746 RepID=UPI0021E28AEE|nr:A-kinase anchor protein 5 [Acomys russatus]